MKWSKSKALSLVVALSLVSGSAFAALGLHSPPPGITTKAWKEMWGRASRAGRAASKLVPGSRVECLTAVFLRVLGDIETVSSYDAVNGEPDIEVTVHPDDAKVFEEALDKERDERCRDDSGGGGSRDAEAAVRYVSNNPEWETADYSARGKRGAARAKALAEARAYLENLGRHAAQPSPINLLKAGVLVPAAEGAASGGLAPAGVAPVIIVPKADCRTQGLLGGKQDPACLSL